MQPNANSLHPLYRDRLGKAFLFVSQKRSAGIKWLRELRPLLSEITLWHGPYHLINVALNVQASTRANKRAVAMPISSYSLRSLSVAGPRSMSPPAILKRSPMID